MCARVCTFTYRGWGCVLVTRSIGEQTDELIRNVGKPYDFTVYRKQTSWLKIEQIRFSPASLRIFNSPWPIFQDSNFSNEKSRYKPIHPRLYHFVIIPRSKIPQFFQTRSHLVLPRNRKFTGLGNNFVQRFAKFSQLERRVRVRHAARAENMEMVRSARIHRGHRFRFYTRCSGEDSCAR